MKTVIALTALLAATPALAQHIPDPRAGAQQMGDIIRSQGAPPYQGPVYQPPVPITIVPPAGASPYSHCLNGSPWC